jgi:regulator of replication initiation timing
MQMDDETRELVRRLQEQVGQLKQQVEQLQQENAGLRDQLEQAQREAARQAAPFRRPDRLNKPKDQQGKPGRKKGHEGACRAVPTRIDENQTPTANRRPLSSVL